MQTEAVKYCKNLMFLLGTEEKVKLIESSNLNEREKQIIVLRFVKGKTVKDCCEEMCLEVDTFNKAQAKAMSKLYFWVSNREKIKEIVDSLFMHKEYISIT